MTEREASLRAAREDIVAEKKPFVWNGASLDTYGEISSAMDSIYRIWQEDRDTGEVEAHRFMQAYRAISEHADANVGYLTGYYGPDTMRELQELFDASHPIFGRTVRTPEEAFAAGAERANGVGASSSAAVTGEDPS